MNPVMQLLQSHCSIRKFTDKPVEDGMIHDIVRCGQIGIKIQMIRRVSWRMMNNYGIITEPGRAAPKIAAGPRR